MDEIKEKLLLMTSHVLVPTLGSPGFFLVSLINASRVLRAVEAVSMFLAILAARGSLAQKGEGVGLGGSTTEAASFT